MQFTPVWKGGKIEDEIIIFVEKDGEISVLFSFLGIFYLKIT